MADDGQEELMEEPPTESERRVIGWIAEYLAAGPAGGVRQTLYASLHLLTNPGQPLEGEACGRSQPSSCVMPDEKRKLGASVLHRCVHTRSSRRR